MKKIRNPNPVIGMLAMAVLLASTSACTQSMYESVYEGARQSVRRDCLKLPEPERDDCLEDIKDDYRAYQRKRETDG